MATVDELKSKVTELETRLKSLSETPDTSRVRLDEQGRKISEWEDTDESLSVVIGAEGAGPVAQRLSSRKAVLKSLHRDYGYVPRSEFKSAGEFYLYGLSNPHGVTADRVNKHFAALKAIQGLNTVSGSDGGFMVMPEFAPGVKRRSYMNSLWSETDQYTVGPNSNGITFLASAETSRANGSRHGGVQGYWIGEGATITKSKPQLREVNVKLNKMAVIVYLTDEMMQDASAMEQYVNMVVEEEFNFMEGNAIINGTGAGMPLGWLNSPALLSVAEETNQDPATILTENVEAVYARLFSGYLPGAKWYYNQNVLPQLNTMTLGLGVGATPVYLPPGGLSSAPYGMLKGLPMTPTEFNPTLGTSGDLLLANPQQYLTITKGGVQRAESIHVEFLTDQKALRFTKRVGGTPWEVSPITPFQGTDTTASAVVIDTRS